MGLKKTEPDQPRRYEYLVSFEMADGSRLSEEEIGKQLWEVLEENGARRTYVSLDERRIRGFKARSVPLTPLEALQHG